jgi:hypothetical protein
MRMIIYISIIIASIAAFVTGIMFNSILLIVPGGVVSIIVFLYFLLKLRKEKESFDIPEDKYETVLSPIKKPFKIRKSILGYVTVIALGIVVLGISYTSMEKYLFKPSSLSIENMINDGCKKLNMDYGVCERDPSNITVNYDVNNDGIVGGVNDTLSNLLGPSCDTPCIKRRCGCRV